MRNTRTPVPHPLLVAVLGLALFVSPSAADGTEALSPAPIAIAQGTTLHTTGATLTFSTGMLELTLPEQPVRQAILHWEVHSSNPVAVGLFDVLIVGNQLVVGERIGGPTIVSPPTRPDVFSSAYRADVTGLVTLKPGPNALAVLGNPARQRSGIGLTVVTGLGDGSGEMLLHDGHDFALAERTGLHQTTTPVTFGFAPATFPRQAAVDLSLAASRTFAPSVIAAQFPGEPVQIFVDKIVTHAGLGPLGILSTWFSVPNGEAEPGWATVRLPLTVPAGASSVTVQVLSLDAATGAFAGKPEAEVRWIAASLALARSPTPLLKQGCGPAFWKKPQNLGAWPAPYAPDDLFADVFGVDLFEGQTLKQVVSLNGEGVFQAMGRHLVAALLNAASPGVSYPLTVDDVLSLLEDVSQAKYPKILKRLLEKNAGNCPLD